MLMLMLMFLLTKTHPMNTYLPSCRCYLTHHQTQEIYLKNHQTYSKPVRVHINPCELTIFIRKLSK